MEKYSDNIITCSKMSKVENPKLKRNIHKTKVKQKKTPEEIYLDIMQHHVQIKKKDKIYNNSILYSVLEELLKMMQGCDALFSCLKPKLAYLGSYFDKLRVGKPTEYDLNVILTLPMNYNKVNLSAIDVQNGYTIIEMPSEFRRLYKTPQMASKGFKETELWCDNHHRLSVKKFRSWMQRVVDATLNCLPKENGSRILTVNNKKYKISARMSGPANTITISENDNTDNDIDVDLVPTLTFSLPKTPIQSKVDFEKVQSTKLNEYFVVPKPSEHDYSWRLAFPFQERLYIRDKNNLKSTLKLLKLLRDVQGFKKLASYFIKTVFLWESAEKSDEFWKQSLSFLVLYMMKKLRDCLEINTIRNFWCPDHNLLEKIKIETCHIWCNRLNRIINDIDKKQKGSPEEILKLYFIKSKSSAI